MDIEKQLDNALPVLESTGTYDLNALESLMAPIGIELLMVPDEIIVELQPPENAKGMGRLSPRWHYTQERSGLWISLRSHDERPRLVRLSVQGDVPGWNPHWVHFSYAVHTRVELIGGDALTAQDVLADDESTLTLLLLPGEIREATLELRPILNGETGPSDYPFKVVLTDAQEEGSETTPGLLRLRHPPATLLQYLPGVYQEALKFEQEDHGSVHPAFFERFLRGFEDAYSPTNELLSNLECFFGPNTAPPDFLPWLATWVALALDENWPELKRRRLMREAVELYRWRGTRRGLTRYLEIYTGFVPQINDQPFTGMRLGPDTLLGQHTMLGNVPSHTFVVTLAVPNPGQFNEQIARDIIESEKPAHTAYILRIVRSAPDQSIQHLDLTFPEESLHATQ